MVGNKKINNIIAITVGSFPYGGASTNRALSYLRGLAEIGCNVSSKLKLNYNNIKIIYTCFKLFPKKKITFIINYIFGILSGIIYLLKFRKRNKAGTTLLLLLIDPILLTIFITLGKILKFKIFHERTEFPNVNYKYKFLLKYYLNNLIPKFDGIFVITNALVDYFKQYTSKKTLMLPMSVEVSRFLNIEKKPKERYIAYCGSMYSNKDGVPDLIEAFNIIAKIDDTVKLYLIGDNSNKQKFNIIQSKINQSEFIERIHCTGYIQRDEMPELLINAEILCLARPDNIQAQGGFPTKLGEYLSTANPVVITDVGEHKLYLQDGISAYISPPGNPVLFAEKIMKVLNNKEKAKEVGKKGQEAAYEYFDYKRQAITLYEYINEI